ncbi:MAG TPA: HNH endonuclease signature motif containing protein, partial [Burkholderiales bacterium]|nr:HNH endonuclease signature motif containing protein [Burkholderiales bacterium]
GHRCASRDYLEYDHVVPVARGGTATVENLRLRCRAHNQLEAERVYGREFMKHKRKGRTGRRSH